jgi:hypothetical protein
MSILLKNLDQKCLIVHISRLVSELSRQKSELIICGHGNLIVQWCGAEGPLSCIHSTYRELRASRGPPYLGTAGAATKQARSAKQVRTRSLLNTLNASFTILM